MSHRGFIAGALAPALLASLAFAAPASAKVDRVLSDERKVSRWAHAAATGKIRVRPSDESRSITRLRYFTEDKRSEKYLLLRGHVDGEGRKWVKLRVPMRPNGRTGWVRREHLGKYRVVNTSLRINRRTLRATLYRSGRRIFSARIGVGAAGTPTPAGRFYIRERIRNLAGSPMYGPWAFGTSAYSVLSDWPGGGVIGIHGTDQPELIPGRPSHGCIRMTNRNITRLKKLMPVGTPVRIL